MISVSMASPMALQIAISYTHSPSGRNCQSGVVGRRPNGPRNSPFIVAWPSIAPVLKAPLDSRPSRTSELVSSGTSWQPVHKRQWNGNCLGIFRSQESLGIRPGTSPFRIDCRMRRSNYRMPPE